MASMPAPAPLHIGWSSIDITPPRPVLLRGQFHARVSQSVRDPLTLTALALQSGESQAVLASVDMVGVPQTVLDGIRQRLPALAPALDPRAVVLSATHTHTAPETDDAHWEDPGPAVMRPGEYAAWLIERGAACIAAAWQARQPGALAWGCGHAVVGWNRRQVRRDGSSLMYGDTSQPEFSHIEGYEDHGVEVLVTCDGRDTPAGLAVNIACPSQVTESAHFVSADYWHEVRTGIRARLGPELQILPQCSAAGDQSPHPMWRRRAEARMLRLKGLQAHEEDLRLAERVEIGRRVVAAVDEVLPAALREIHPCPVFAHVTRTLELPRRAITAADCDHAREQIAACTARLAELSDRPTTDPERSRCYSRRRWFQGVLDRCELQRTRPTCPVEIHVLRLGDVAVATNPFELYLDYGVRLKARSPALQTFVVQLSGPGTYLPTARSVAGGSYGSEPASNLVGPAAGDMLVEETLAELHRLFA